MEYKPWTLNISWLHATAWNRNVEFYHCFVQLRPDITIVDWWYCNDDSSFFVSQFSFYCIYAKFTLVSATAATVLQIISGLQFNPMSVEKKMLIKAYANLAIRVVWYFDLWIFREERKIYVQMAAPGSVTQYPWPASSLNLQSTTPLLQSRTLRRWFDLAKYSATSMELGAVERAPARGDDEVRAGDPRGGRARAG